jgi:glycerophosphoryl diester phosphodiesterase
MTDLSWLIKRPIAHRGLHDKDNRIIENTASAFAAAIVNNFAIETDLQLTRDGEAAVFHDATLDRLLETKGPVVDVTMKQLRQASFKNTDDHIQSLGELLDQVAGKVPLVVEIKSKWGKEGILERRIADVIGNYKGQLALMSFNPSSIALIREYAPACPRGIVAEHISWQHLTSYPQTKFDFLAYKAQNLPALAPLCAKYIFKMPLLAWTVRTKKDHMKARWADQIIFENYVPETISSP